MVQRRQFFLHSPMVNVCTLFLKIFDYSFLARYFFIAIVLYVSIGIRTYYAIRGESTLFGILSRYINTLSKLPCTAATTSS